MDEYITKQEARTAFLKASEYSEMERWHAFKRFINDIPPAKVRPVEDETAIVHSSDNPDGELIDI